MGGNNPQSSWREKQVKMETQGKRRPTAWSRCVASAGFAFFLGVSSLCLCLAGCAGQNRAPAGDPLLGEAAARPAAAPVAGATPPASIPVPPAPAPYPNGSNAALAGGQPKPLDENNNLRIGTPTPLPDNRPPPPPASGGTFLNQPQPVPVPTPPPDPQSTRNFGTLTSNRAGNYEQAQALLAAHGVNWQRLETWGDQGGWKFSCSIPSKQNANISRTYEAQARDYLTAMQAVLEQIEKEK